MGGLTTMKTQKLWNTTKKADLEVDLNLPVSRSSP